MKPFTAARKALAGGSENNDYRGHQGLPESGPLPRFLTFLGFDNEGSRAPRRLCRRISTLRTGSARPGRCQPVRWRWRQPLLVGALRGPGRAQHDAVGGPFEPQRPAIKTAPGCCARFLGRPPPRVNHRELAERFLDLRSRDPAWLPRATCLRHAPRPLVIEPKKRLKSEGNSRFRAKPDAPDNPYYRAQSDPR